MDDEMGMGAEEENGEANQRSGPNPTPNPLTQAQFLSWKRHKVLSLSFFLGF